MDVERLAQTLSTGALFDLLNKECGGFDPLHHWQQGEFHQDLVLSVKDPHSLPGSILVVATNCNAGVKEVLCLIEAPTESALWHSRCPDSVEFSGAMPAVLAAARTRHWFDPAKLLTADARSEYREEFRERQPGGGWRLKTDS